MGKIIHFHESRKEKTVEENLVALMRKAKSLQKEEGLRESPETISKSTFLKMEKMIEREISDTIIQKAHINSAYFLCGNYIAKMISKSAENPPESWYVIDYLANVSDEKDYWNWQKAADVCFLICTLFTGRANRRMMKYKDYQRMGESLYGTFYHKFRRYNKKKENEVSIGYLMSANYQAMAQITREALL